MSTSVIVYVLTALAAVVVVLTRLRLRRDGATGRVHVGQRIVTLHTVLGLLALVLWVVFLVLPDSSGTGSYVGIAALFLWWVVVALGLMVLARWLPARGRHATPVHDDRWWRGLLLSLLGHVGLLAGVAYFTYAYMTSEV